MLRLNNLIIFVVQISAAFILQLRENRLYGSCMMFFKRELCHFLRNIPFLIQ